VTHTLTEWVLFNLFMIALLAIDMGFFSRKAHVIHVREAMIRSVVWIALAFLFAGFMYFRRGHAEALLYITGYLTEETLSVDNLFVVLIIFSYFQVPRHHQHKVLLWGIFGALVMRAAFIILGVQLVGLFHWTFYVFGAILVYTAIKLLVSEEQYDPQQNLFLRFSRRYLPITENYIRDRFFARIDGRLMMTPLFVVLWVVNTTDLLFAVDSVPAVVAVVTPPGTIDSSGVYHPGLPDAFIAYSSNAFAIVGLRSLYFALAGMLDAFHFLRYGLSAILGFVGVKMLIEDWYSIPNSVVLGVVGGCLALSVVASLVFKKQPDSTDEQEIGVADASQERLESAP
jgi:tellurite resistance protein TerC